jgi:hypothetical protein
MPRRRYAQPIAAPSRPATRSTCRGPWPTATTTSSARVASSSAPASRPPDRSPSPRRPRPLAQVPDQFDPARVAFFSLGGNLRRRLEGFRDPELTLSVDQPRRPFRLRPDGGVPRPRGGRCYAGFLFHAREYQKPLKETAEPAPVGDTAVPAFRETLTSGHFVWSQAIFAGWIPPGCRGSLERLR